MGKVELKSTYRVTINGELLVATNEKADAKAYQEEVLELAKKYNIHVDVGVTTAHRFVLKGI